MFELNSRAWSFIEEMVSNEDEFKVKSYENNGALIVDCGINVPGSQEAGLMVTRICLGGYGSLKIIEEKPIPSCLGTMMVEIEEYPVESTLGSQFAGWRISKKFSIETSNGIKEKKYSAMGSGPARAIAQEPKDLYDKLDLQKENSEQAVILLETNKLPPKEVIQYISEKCEVKPSNLAILCAPTNSLVGSIQIAGRVVETGIHKLKEVGLDLALIKEAYGNVPIVPVASDPIIAMGVTNDAIIYYGYVKVVLDDLPSNIVDIIQNTPSNRSKDYGEPFQQIFERVNYDFYKIDAGLFAPACIEVRVSDIVVSAGTMNLKGLYNSFKIAKL